jgi:hypothetical protein
LKDGRYEGADGAPVAAGDNVVVGVKLMDGACVGGQLILCGMGLYDGRCDGSALGPLGCTVGALVAASDGTAVCDDASWAYELNHSAQTSKEAVRGGDDVIDDDEDNDDDEDEDGELMVLPRLLTVDVVLKGLDSGAVEAWIPTVSPWNLMNPAGAS